jgi:axin 1
MTSSNRVCQFLTESGGHNFTETAPRPPVPGEENELQSNGGASTRSSGSHKSHVSNRSHTSIKSVGSNRDRGDVPQSPAVTPRRSNRAGGPGGDSGVNKSHMLFTGSCSILEDVDAPLGFEPEGSAANSPPFTENSTPSYLKWAESLTYLLADRDGVQLFRTFLEQEGLGTYSVEFWFACQGLKKKASEEGTELIQIQNVIRVIHKKYVKSDKLPCVHAETKRIIHDKIQRRTDLTAEIFDAAQGEVEEDMRNNTYPLFLKSDLYVQYVQKGGESPKTSNSSSGSNSARPLSGPLPTLMEDEVLQDVSMDTSSMCGGAPPRTKVNTPVGGGGGAKKVEAFTR